MCLLKLRLNFSEYDLVRYAKIIDDAKNVIDRDLKNGGRYIDKQINIIDIKIYLSIIFLVLYFIEKNFHSNYIK